MMHDRLLVPMLRTRGSQLEIQVCCVVFDRRFATQVIQTPTWNAKKGPERGIKWRGGAPPPPPKWYAKDS